MSDCKLQAFTKLSIVLKLEENSHKSQNTYYLGNCVPIKSFQSYSCTSQNFKQNVTTHNLVPRTQEKEGKILLQRQLVMQTSFIRCIVLRMYQRGARFWKIL